MWGVLLTSDASKALPVSRERELPSRVSKSHGKIPIPNEFSASFRIDRLSNLLRSLNKKLLAVTSATS